MKKIIYALSIIIFATISLFAQNETLRGDEAIAKLKQTGQYDSLMEAVRDARKDNAQTNEPNTEDAFGQTAKLLASDGAANEFFGQSVAISGDTAIVGSPKLISEPGTRLGSAYVFVRSGTTWIEQQKLTGSDTVPNDLFGISVAISGDTVIIGARADDVGANADQGSAYIFVRSGTSWTEQQKLTAADGATNDQFGISVDISGETAIVGAFLDDIGANSNQGSAYIFVRSGTTWSQQKLTAADGATSDNFGGRVAISGETAIVGASGDDIGTNTNQGSAYVFVRSGTAWIEQQKLTAADGAANDFFGGVAISGETAIVGAAWDDGAQGSAYIFVRSGTSWTEQQKLTAADGAAVDRFGESVAISGEKAIVGAFLDDIGANTNQGSAYVFVRSGTIWSQQKLTAADGAAFDGFGVRVAISGETAIVTANSDDVGANADQGSAYVFRVLKTAFDFDGDSKDDVSVYRNGIWYLLRSQLGFSAVNWGLPTDKTVAGDYDGDGKADMAVFRDGAWIILNSSNGTVSIVNWGLAGDIPMVGDYDGDNKTDLTVFRNGVWYILQSSNGGFVFASFGLPTDKPVVGKFDADNRSDIAVFRDGNWYILGSLSGFSAVGFGATGDVPVPGDYDGDGRTDVAVFRGGNWYVLRSTAGFLAVGWGLSTDTPVPADYDGDGKSDVAVFRNGNWYILQSSNGAFSAVGFGTTGDRPIPAQLQ